MEAIGLVAATWALQGREREESRAPREESCCSHHLGWDNCRINASAASGALQPLQGTGMGTALLALG